MSRRYFSKTHTYNQNLVKLLLTQWLNRDIVFDEG